METSIDANNSVDEFDRGEVSYKNSLQKNTPAISTLPTRVTIPSAN